MLENMDCRDYSWHNYNQDHYNNLCCCSLLLYMVSYNEGGMQAKGISKQDPEANIWAKEG